MRTQALNKKSPARNAAFGRLAGPLNRATADFNHPKRLIFAASETMSKCFPAAWPAGAQRLPEAMVPDLQHVSAKDTARQGHHYCGVSQISAGVLDDREQLRTLSGAQGRHLIGIVPR